jgi:hypothetical protein
MPVRSFEYPVNPIYGESVDAPWVIVHRKNPSGGDLGR